MRAFKQIIYRLWEYLVIRWVYLTGKGKRRREWKHYRRSEGAKKVWLTATRAAGLDVTIHDLRHVHGHWAIDEGVAESKVQSSYRHTSAAMTRDYVRRLDSGEVSDALADAVLGKQKKTRRKA